MEYGRKRWGKCRVCSHIEKVAKKEFNLSRGARCTICGGVLDRIFPHRPKRGQEVTYRDRNALLFSLGYPSYVDYLQSPLWKGIRIRAFALLGRACRLCRGPADDLHHIGYGIGTLLGEDLTQLVPLCSTCHTKVEFTSRGGRVRKRSLAQSQREYYRLLSASGQPRGRRCIKCGLKAKRGNLYCFPCSHPRGRRIPGPSLDPTRLGL